MAYPASVQISTPARIANWRPIVQWFPAIPHIVVALVLASLGTIVGVIAWLVVLITGRLPEGMAGFLTMCLRYGTRVFAYVAFLTDKYPKFDFTTSAADPGGSATSVNFSPALEGRKRLMVVLRMIIPLSIMLQVSNRPWNPIDFSVSVWLVAIILGIVAIPALVWHGITLIIGVVVCLVLGFFAVLFTGRWPAGLRRFVAGALTVGVRYHAYTLFLTDKYPPFLNRQLMHSSLIRFPAVVTL